MSLSLPAVLTNPEVSIEEISQETGVLIDDILHTLIASNMLRYHKGQHIIAMSEKHRLDYKRSVDKQKDKIDRINLHWTPPVFTHAQLRYI